MGHNTPRKNAEFQQTWCESNLLYLLWHEDQLDPETIRKIAFMREEIIRLGDYLNKSTESK